MVSSNPYQIDTASAMRQAMKSAAPAFKIIWPYIAISLGICIAAFIVTFLAYCIFGLTGKTFGKSKTEIKKDKRRFDFWFNFISHVQDLTKAMRHK